MYSEKEIYIDLSCLQFLVFLLRTSLFWFIKCTTLPNSWYDMSIHSREVYPA